MNVNNLASLIKNLGVPSETQSRKENSKSEFKSLMKESGTSTVETSKEGIISETDSKSITDEITDVVEKIENEDEDKIIEEIMGLLQSLNIQVVDNSTLPILIDLQSEFTEVKPEFTEIQSGEMLIDSDNLSNLLDELTLNLNDITTSNDTNLEITKDNIDKILALLADKDGNKVSKEKFVEVVNSFNDNSEGKKTSGIEMVTMIFKGEETSSESNEEDLLMKMLLEATDLNEADKVTGDETVVFTDLLTNKSNNSESVILESKPVTINKETASTDVVRNLNYMIKNNIQQLTVKVYPKELGEITIKLLSEDGIMRADIKATSKETYNLLNSNMEEIKKYLSNENISIKEVNIDLYNEDTTYYSGESFESGFNQEKQNDKNQIDEKELVHMEEEQTKDTLEETSNVNLLA